MVAVSPGTDAEDAIRWGGKLADFLRCRWILLYVGALGEVDARNRRGGRDVRDRHDASEQIGQRGPRTHAGDHCAGRLSALAHSVAGNGKETAPALCERAYHHANQRAREQYPE